MYLIQPIALQKTRKMNAAINVEQGQSLSLDRSEEAEVDVVSEEVVVKTSKHGSSVRTTVSITSRQDVLITGGMPPNGDNGGSIRNRDRKVSKVVKSTVVEEKKEIKKKTSMMEFHNIKISQVISMTLLKQREYEFSRANFYYVHTVVVTLICLP